MTKSEWLLVGAGVTIVLTIAGVAIAAVFYPAIIPIIAGAGSLISAALSHELVKSLGVRVMAYLNQEEPEAVPLSPQLGLELTRRLNRHPHNTQTLIFSREYSSLDSEGHHVHRSVEGRMQETTEDVTPPESRGSDSFHTAGNSPRVSPRNTLELS